MTALVQDVRYALRSLAQSPGFASLALTMLALGVSANAAVFTICSGHFRSARPRGSSA
jgi:putative ABC transport system permease protein